MHFRGKLDFQTPRFQDFYFGFLRECMGFLLVSGPSIYALIKWNSVSNLAWCSCGVCIAHIHEGLDKFIVGQN